MVNLDDLKNILEALRAYDGGESMGRTSCPTSALLPDLSTKPPSPVAIEAAAATSSGETDLSLSCLGRAGDGEAGRRAVRFADECGSNLVTKVIHSTYWWDDLIFGVDRCPNCGHVASPATPNPIDAGDAFSRNGRHQKSEVSVMEPVTCESCGVSFRTQAPGELFQFIEELSKGVEATLIESALIGMKRKRVLLYTEDNGKTISWLETGNSRASKPHNVPCNTLLEVKDSTGLASRRATGHQVGQSPATAEDVTMFPVFPTGRGPQHQVEAAMVKPYKSKSKKLEAAKSAAGLPSEGGLYRGDNYDPEAADGEDDACGRANDVRIKLRWRLKPKSSLKKVTIVNVSCSCPAVFARGMMRLQEHNTDLLK